MQWIIGQTISTGVLRGLLNRDDQWGWRIPYATQWAWPIPIIIGVLLAPEVRPPRSQDSFASYGDMLISPAVPMVARPP